MALSDYDGRVPEPPYPTEPASGDPAILIERLQEHSDRLLTRIEQTEATARCRIIADPDRPAVLRDILTGLFGVSTYPDAGSAFRYALEAIIDADDEGDGHAFIHAMRDAKKLLGRT